MSLIYRLPDISSRPLSYKIDDGAVTMGLNNAPLLSARPGKSGIHLLSDGRDAFAARAVLARIAEKSIDVQYYMYHQDTVGSLLTYELLRLHTLRLTAATMPLRRIKDAAPYQFLVR